METQRRNPKPKSTHLTFEDLTRTPVQNRNAQPPKPSYDANLCPQQDVPASPPSFKYAPIPFQHNSRTYNLHRFEFIRSKSSSTPKPGALSRYTPETTRTPKVSSSQTIGPQELQTAPHSGVDLDEFDTICNAAGYNNQ